MGPFPTPVLAGSGSRVLHFVESQTIVQLAHNASPKERQYYLLQSSKSHQYFTKLVLGLIF